VARCRTVALVVLLAAFAARAEDPPATHAEPGPYAPGCYLATRWHTGEPGGTLPPEDDAILPMAPPPPNRLTAMLICWGSDGHVTTAAGVMDQAPPGVWYPLLPAVMLHPDCGRVVPHRTADGPGRYFTFEDAAGRIECGYDAEQRRTLCYCPPAPAPAPAPPPAPESAPEPKELS
jgi:hypothetical protein